MSNTDYGFEMNFNEIAKGYPKDLKLYKPFNDFFEIVNSCDYDKNLHDQLILSGETALKSEYPVLLASDYMKFKREGNRSDFEAAYFAKRHILNDLCLAECTEKKGRFVDKIIDGIFSICEESSWCLPAHNTYIRDTPQHILPDSTHPVMDLFACETGAQLSMILYFLSDELDSISPFITTRIKYELNCRIIKPYLNEHFWWMGNGNEPMCNWTSWCTQNVLLCAFLDNGLEISSLDRRKIFEKAAASVDFFLKDYGNDGCCDEGAQYYKHAGLCLYGCMEILNGISDNAFGQLYLNEKIKNIAAYIALVHVDGPWYFNFSDCSPKAGRAGAREFHFARKTQQNFLCDFAAKDYQKTIAEGSMSKDESIKLNLYYKAQSYYSYIEISKYQPEEASKVIAPNVWYESVGLMILRNNIFALAVKAGDNDDSHNHNDTGSITLYKDGKPILVDIGVETYSAKTFSDDRYSIWTMQSGYHNLPTLMGQDELQGANHCATNIKLINGSDSDYSGLSMNIEKAYSDDISNKYYYNRTVTLNSIDNVVLLTDTTDVPDTMLNFITYEKPEVKEDSNGLKIVIGGAQLLISGANLKEIQTLPITDARLKKAWDHDLYRIRLNMNGQFNMMIS